MQDLAEKHKVKVIQIAMTNSAERPDDAAFQRLQTLTPGVLGGPTSHVWLRATGEQAPQAEVRAVPAASHALVVMHRQHS